MHEYEKLEKLGEGTYGVVYKARNIKTGEYVALKRVRLEQENEGLPPTSIREISILRELHHPNIVELREVINNNGLILIFEYLDMDLRRYLLTQRHPPPPILVKSYAYQILCGLCHCHCHRIIHRDMKPQNLLLDRAGHIKICDFGLARAFTLPLRGYTHEVITLWYRPPEILLKSKTYSLAVDIWSTGAIIAEMITKTPLFPGDSEIDQIYRIFKILGTPTAAEWPDYPKLPAPVSCYPDYKRRNLAEVIPGAEPLALDLISRMLTYDPSKRISAKAAINHPYFNELSPEIRRRFRPKEVDDR